MLLTFTSLLASSSVLNLIAAVLPAVLLMIYIYRQDRFEAEPGALLGKLILGGVFAGIVSIILENIADFAILGLLPYHNTNSLAVWTALSVGLIEEGTKFFFLKKYTWNDYHFNARFDGIVYAVFVSLGFAAFENVLYISEYGIQIALTRAIFAIPAHLGFSVFMGLFYGRAKEWEAKGKKSSMNVSLWTGYGIAVLMHTFYDATAMMDGDLANGLFFAFVILMYVVVFTTIRKESREDRCFY